jgi:hypothetical protein
MLVLLDQIKRYGGCSVSLFRHERLQNDEYFLQLLLILACCGVKTIDFTLALGIPGITYKI